MGGPFISVRKHYRLVPGEPTEPTSTIVLTSKDSYYVDVRILRDVYEDEKGKGIYTKDCLDWAFFGKSRITKEEYRDDGTRTSWHVVWDHWVDSKTDEPEPDEADMRLQDDGTTLEEGVNVDAVSGAETRYEELWEDLPVDAFGKKQNRSSVVLKTEESNNKANGMVIKIGGWCQGIVKIGEDLTVERWQWKSKDVGGEDLDEEVGKDTRTQNDWVRVLKIGTGILPCEMVCSHTTGKHGSTTLYKHNDIKWRVMEEYYF